MGIAFARLNDPLEADGVGVGEVDVVAFSPSTPDTFPIRVLSIAHRFLIDVMRAGNAVEASLGSAEEVAEGSRNCVWFVLMKQSTHCG